jgi:hypothetical protein
MAAIEDVSDYAISGGLPIVYSPGSPVGRRL